MATVNIGRLKFKWQGNYSSGTAYVVDDVVYHGGNSYVCINDSTGNAPTNTSYWQKMAQGSDLGSLSGITQGDVVYYNGTDWTRLAAGTSGQFLKTNGSGGNPVWDDVDTDIDNILPSQTSNSGKYLTTDGTNSSWGDVSSDIVKVYDNTITSSTNIVNITNVFDATYKYYRMMIQGISASGSNDMWHLRFYDQNGAEMTGNNYYTAHHRAYASSSTDGQNTARGWGSASITPYWDYSGGWLLEITFVYMYDSNNQIRWFGTHSGYDTATLANTTFAGWYGNASTNASGLKMETVSGNTIYGSGTKISIYGYK